MLYTIGEMSKITGVPASTLRYYDKEGLLPFLKHTENNTRVFSEEEYEALKVIDCLKKAGLSIKDIKIFMNLVRDGDNTIKDRLGIFRKQRESVKNEIKKLKETLAIIEYKCWYYETASKTGNEKDVKCLPIEKIPEEFKKIRKNLRNIPSE